jgi:hypothetical protein
MIPIFLVLETIGRKHRTPLVLLHTQGPVMRSLTQGRNNLVSEPTMTASSSSTAKQQLEDLETRLEADRQEMLARREVDR